MNFMGCVLLRARLHFYTISLKSSLVKDAQKASQKKNMFRRSPFFKSSLPANGEDSLHPPMPGDEQAPSTPIPERPTLSTSGSWQDPNEPRSASWTSQAATYDVNPKYTTANQSYTHRRRKSGVITNLIGNSDPYQPTYQDWREGVASPESLRPRSKSWSFFGRRKSRHFGVENLEKRKCGNVTKIVAVLFMLVSLILSGLWLFGGPMPLVTVDGLKALDWKFHTSSAHPGNWQMNPKALERARYRERWTWVKRWMPSSARRDDLDEDVYSSASTSQAAQTAAAISIDFDPDVLQSFGVQTLERVTRKASSTVTSASATNTDGSLTILGDPVSSDEASSSQSRDMPVVEIIDSNDGGDAEVEAHRKRSQAMWKKYAEIPEDGRTTSAAGTLADAISPPTETLASS